MSVTQEITALKREMEHSGIHPERGLGDELFLFASTLMPVVNVDLLVRNREGQFLLTWRDDSHCGSGWHIPGGCVRFRESFAERAQKTALREFGHSVDLDLGVVHVFEIFTLGERPIRDQNERAHFITLVMSGTMPEDFQIADQPLKPGQPGYMQWFSQLPGDLLQVQCCYREHWDEINRKLKGITRHGNLEK